MNEIRKSSENLRKFFVQLQFKWPANRVNLLLSMKCIKKFTLNFPLGSTQKEVKSL